MKKVETQRTNIVTLTAQCMEIEMANAYPRPRSIPPGLSGGGFTLPVPANDNPPFRIPKPANDNFPRVPPSPSRQLGKILGRVGRFARAVPGPLGLALTAYAWWKYEPGGQVWTPGEYWDLYAQCRTDPGDILRGTSSLYCGPHFSLPEQAAPRHTWREDAYGRTVHTWEVYEYTQPGLSEWRWHRGFRRRVTVGDLYDYSGYKPPPAGEPLGLTQSPATYSPVPVPAPSPSIYPLWLPGQFPDAFPPSVPGGVPDPVYAPPPIMPGATPRPTPAPHPLPWPGLPDVGPSSPVPAPRPVPGSPIVEPGGGVDITPGQPIKPSPAPSPRPRPGRPSRGQKERKVALALSGRPAAIVSAAGEAIDFVKNLYGCLPKSIKTKIWRRNLDLVLQGKRKSTNLTPQEMAQHVYTYADQVDLNCAFQGWLFESEGEDRAYGQSGQQLADANRQSGRFAGFGLGPAI